MSMKSGTLVRKFDVKSLFLVMLSGLVAMNAIPADAAVKSVVLVHGAFADGSGWKPLADVLMKDGFSVHVVQIPETSFQDDVAALTRDPLDGM